MSRGIPQMIQGKREYEEGQRTQSRAALDKAIWEEDYKVKTGEYKDTVQKYADKALNRYEALARQGMPEQQRQNYLTDIDRATADSLAQRSTRRGGLMGIGSLDRANRDAYRDLLEMDATTRLANQFRLAEVAPQYEGAGDRFEMEREMYLSDLGLEDIYESRDYGRWMEQEGFRKHQEGWAQFDEDLMTWMTMGAGGGMGGGGGADNKNESNPYERGGSGKEKRRKKKNAKKYGGAMSDPDTGAYGYDGVG